MVGNDSEKHIDEGVIHAWLDGALPPEEAARVEGHVAGCAVCSAAVAEARGLIAAASRIVGALDHAPAGVIPASRQGAVAWHRAWPVRLAASIVVAVVGSLVVVNRLHVGGPAPVLSDSVVPAAGAPAAGPTTGGPTNAKPTTAGSTTAGSTTAGSATGGPTTAGSATAVAPPAAADAVTPSVAAKAAPAARAGKAQAPRAAAPTAAAPSAPAAPAPVMPSARVAPAAGQEANASKSGAAGGALAGKAAAASAMRSARAAPAAGQDANAPMSEVAGAAAAAKATAPPPPPLGAVVPAGAASAPPSAMAQGRAGGAADSTHRLQAWRGTALLQQVVVPSREPAVDSAPTPASGPICYDLVSAPAAPLPRRIVLDTVSLGDTHYAARVESTSTAYWTAPARDSVEVVIPDRVTLTGHVTQREWSGVASVTPVSASAELRPFTARRCGPP